MVAPVVAAYNHAPLHGGGMWAARMCRGCSVGLNHDGEIAVPPDRGREEVFLVVVNHEGQHSIWPSRRPLPAGWTETDARGDPEECLAHIERTWTDMRPLSLCRRMEAGTSDVGL